MSRLWAFLGSKRNREIIAWWGGGIVIVIAGLWSAFVYFYPPKETGEAGNGGVRASHGSVSAGGNVTVESGDCSIAAGGAATGNTVACGPPAATQSTKP
jgi:hypothetical protein